MKTQPENIVPMLDSTCLLTVLQNNIQYSVGISSSIKCFKFKAEGDNSLTSSLEQPFTFLINKNTVLISVFNMKPDTNQLLTKP